MTGIRETKFPERISPPIQQLVVASYGRTTYLLKSRYHSETTCSYPFRSLLMYSGRSDLTTKLMTEMKSGNDFRTLTFRFPPPLMGTLRVIINGILKGNFTGETTDTRVCCLRPRTTPRESWFPSRVRTEQQGPLDLIYIALEYEQDNLFQSVSFSSYHKCKP